MFEQAIDGADTVRVLTQQRDRHLSSQVPPDARRRGFHPNKNKKVPGLRLQPSANSTDQVSLARSRVSKDCERSREASRRYIMNQPPASFEGFRVDLGNVHLMVIQRLPH
jgi:hypothetical protein